MIVTQQPISRNFSDYFKTNIFASIDSSDGMAEDEDGSVQQ